MDLEVINLTYKHKLNKKFGLGPLSFSCKNYLRILGANGSGKTTFLKCLAGIYKATSGDIILSKLKPKKITWVGTEATIFWDTLTSYEYIKLQSSLYGVPNAEVKREVAKYDINYMDQKTFTLSTGQKKIISTIASIISKCPLVILDEPDSNLDSYNTEILYKLIKTESALGKQFFVFSSHSSSDYFSKDNTIVLDSGIVQC